MKKLLLFLMLLIPTLGLAQEKRNYGKEALDWIKKEPSKVINGPTGKAFGLDKADDFAIESGHMVVDTITGLAKGGAQIVTGSEDQDSYCYTAQKHKQELLYHKFFSDSASYEIAVLIDSSVRGIHKDGQEVLQIVENMNFIPKVFDSSAVGAVKNDWSFWHKVPIEETAPTIHDFWRRDNYRCYLENPVKIKDKVLQQKSDVTNSFLHDYKAYLSLLALSNAPFEDVENEGLELLRKHMTFD